MLNKILLLMLAMSSMPKMLAMDVWLRDPYYDSAEFKLHIKLDWAASAGNLAEIKRLIAAGAKPQLLRCNSASTALMNAINYGREEICQLLATAGADLALRNSGTNYGCKDTPLILAARRGQRAICEFFVHHQAQIVEERETVLLCLNRLKNNGDQCARLLYNQRKSLLLPYLGNYVPFKSWLNCRDHFGKRAYDYLQIDCLNQEKRFVPPASSSSGAISLYLGLLAICVFGLHKAMP
jgi:ankyrin repeat protein